YIRTPIRFRFSILLSIVVALTWGCWRASRRSARCAFSAVCPVLCVLPGILSEEFDKSGARTRSASPRSASGCASVSDGRGACPDALGRAGCLPDAGLICGNPGREVGDVRTERLDRVGVRDQPDDLLCTCRGTAGAVEVCHWLSDDHHTGVACQIGTSPGSESTVDVAAPVDGDRRGGRGERGAGGHGLRQRCGAVPGPDHPPPGSAGGGGAASRPGSPPLARIAPTIAPADVPTTRSAAPRSTPWRRRPSASPASHAVPTGPPGPRTTALSAITDRPPQPACPGRAGPASPGGCCRRRSGTGGCG